MSDLASRNALIFSAVGHAYMHFFTAMYFVIAVTLGKEAWAGLTWSEASELWMLGAFLVGVAALPAGWLADRWSASGMMVVYFFGMGLCAIACALVEQPVALMLGLAGVGLFAAIYHPVGIPWVVRNAKTRRGKALGINGVFGQVGWASAGLITGILIDAFLLACRIPRTGRDLPFNGRFAAGSLACGTRGRGRCRSRSQHAGKPRRHDPGLCRATLDHDGDGPGLPRQSGGAAEAFRRPADRSLRRCLGIPGAQRARGDGDLPWWTGCLVGRAFRRTDRDRWRHHANLGWPSCRPLFLEGDLPLGLPAAGFHLGVYRHGRWSALVALSIIAVALSTGALPAENILLARYAPKRHQAVAFGVKYVLAFGTAPIAISAAAYIRESYDGFAWLYVLGAVIAAAAALASAMLPRDTEPVAIRVPAE